MYFIPEKGRFYRWAVHTRPTYRYALTIGMLALLGVAWFFLIDPWFVGLVQYEQAALNRAVQEKREACVAERAITYATTQIDKASMAIQEMVRNQDKNQTAFLFDAAQKAGVQINAFAKEKEKRKEWVAKQYVSFSANGDMDQILNFLSAIAQSSYMIQCKRLALQASDKGSFSAHFQFACVSLIS